MSDRQNKRAGGPTPRRAHTQRGRALQDWMDGRGLSASELARVAGVGRQAVHRAVHGDGGSMSVRVFEGLLAAGVPRALLAG